MALRGREIQLAARPQGEPRESDFRLVEVDVDGLEHAPAAFIGLLRGENTGKMLVKL